MAGKTKRRTKHRGNAAGMVEKRGGSGRSGKQQTGARVPVALRVPTWRSAFIRAGLITLILAIFLIVFGKRSPLSVALLAVILLAVYVPFGYYTDKFFYNRRQKKIAAAKTKAKG